MCALDYLVILRKVIYFVILVSVRDVMYKYTIPRTLQQLNTNHNITDLLQSQVNDTGF